MRVSRKDPQYEIENENYDNLYVMGPNSFIQRYLVPKHPQILDYVTEDELKNMFRVSTLPRALVLRSDIMNSQ